MTAACVRVDELTSVAGDLRLGVFARAHEDGFGRAPCRRHFPERHASGALRREDDEPAVRRPHGRAAEDMIEGQAPRHAIGSRARSALRYVLEPKAIVLGFALLHFLSVFIYVVRGSLTDGGRDADLPLYYMPTPTLILLAALGLWRGRPWSYCLALILSSWPVYQLGYRWLAWLSGELHAPIYSVRVLAAWWRMAFSEWADYPDRARSVFQLALAGVIALCSFGSVVYVIFRRLARESDGI